MNKGFHNYHRLMNEAGAGDAGGGAPAATDSLATDTGASAGGTALAGDVPTAGASAPEPSAPSVTIPENWKEALPQEFRDEPSLKAINNLESLVKSYVHSQKMIGRGKMQVPDQHASDADWKQVYQQLGLPERIEDYDVPLPEDANFEDGFVSKIKEVAYEQGILPKQMKGLMDWYSKANNEAIANHEQQMKSERVAELQKLKNEWGQAFDQRINMAKAALKHTGLGEQVYDWLNDTGLGDDPTMIKLLSAMGQMLKEDGLVGDFGQDVSGPKELQARIDEIEQSDAFMNPSHPNRKKLLEERNQLYSQLYPTKKDSNPGLLT